MVYREKENALAGRSFSFSAGKNLCRLPQKKMVEAILKKLAPCSGISPGYD
jgi:hypothetical protein